jgi:hypothetical protein
LRHVSFLTVYFSAKDVNIFELFCQTSKLHVRAQQYLLVVQYFNEL